MAEHYEATQQAMCDTDTVDSNAVSKKLATH
jgi:hypothetical protein